MKGRILLPNKEGGNFFNFIVDYHPSKKTTVRSSLQIHSNKWILVVLKMDNPCRCSSNIFQELKWKSWYSETWVIYLHHVNSSRRSKHKYRCTSSIKLWWNVAFNYIDILCMRLCLSWSFKSCFYSISFLCILHIRYWMCLVISLSSA